MHADKELEEMDKGEWLLIGLRNRDFWYCWRLLEGSCMIWTLIISIRTNDRTLRRFMKDCRIGLLILWSFNLAIILVYSRRTNKIVNKSLWFWIVIIEFDKLSIIVWYYTLKIVVNYQIMKILFEVLSLKKIHQSIEFLLNL